MKLFLVSIVATWVAFVTAPAPVYKQPEQVHLSYGGKCHVLLVSHLFNDIPGGFFLFFLVVGYSQMVVTWMTFEPTSNSVVEYGLEPFEFNITKQGAATHFMNEKRDSYTHRVLLTNLKPDTVYCEILDFN